MKKITGLSAVLVVAILLLSCNTKNSKKEAETSNDIVSVRVESLQKEKRDYIIHTSGQLTTNDETYLSFKSDGVVNSILVKEGDHIHKGQLLAMLDLMEINAKVKQAELNVEKTQRDYTRTGNLYKDSVATLEQLQNSKTVYEGAIHQLDAAKFNRIHSEIRAFEDGYVLRKFVNAGQVVTSGSPILQTNGAGKSEWALKAGLSDKEWSAVSINDSATIVTDVTGNQKLKAIVIRKTEGADPYTGSFVVELKITSKNVPYLASGLFGRAQINASAKKELWLIPYEALLDGNGSNGYVYVTNDNKTAQKISVEIESLSKEGIYISKGLENAKNLIIAGSPYLKENSLISIVSQ